MKQETCYLQLFAEGISGEGNAADAGQQSVGDTPARAETTQDAAANTTRLTWEQILADPEYNRQIQAIVRARLKAAGSTRRQSVTNVGESGDTLGGHSVTQPGSKSKVPETGSTRRQSVPDAESNVGTGVPDGPPVGADVSIGPQDGKPIPYEQGRIATAPAALRNDKRGDMSARIRRHYDDLVAQEANLREIFPNFSLQQALRDPEFARLTAPHVGVSVENAYYLRNRRAHQGLAMELAARKTAEKLANAVRSGSHRPVENGTDFQGPAVTSFDYAHATAQQRESLKKAIRRSASRGEKLYPEELR